MLHCTCVSCGPSITACAFTSLHYQLHPHFSRRSLSLSQCIRRCCPCCFGPRPRARTEISVLVLGLGGAGKTTLMAAVAGELTDNDDEPSPTMGNTGRIVDTEHHSSCIRLPESINMVYVRATGFAFKTVNVQDHLTLNFQELGGSEQIRMYWDRYYACKHLVVSLTTTQARPSTSKTFLQHVCKIPADS